MAGGLPAPVKEAQASPGNIIWVPDNYSTIQAAVNASSPGDTIIVRDGTYNENVKVNIASLTIQSQNGTANCIVSASNPSDHVFYVTASYVNITGLTVRNATGADSAGIYLNIVDHCNISANNVTNNFNGIYLEWSDNNTITSNTAYNNWEGIFLEYSSNNNLTSNTAKNNYYGIYLESSSNNNLTSNTAYNNTQAGIYLYSSSNDTLTGNNVTLNGDGIYMNNTRNLLLEGNTVMNNTAQFGGGEGDGIRAAGVCNDTVIRGNNISYNNWGIDLYVGDFVNFTIVNNSMSYNPNAGMWIENTSDSTMEGNEVSHATDATYGIGICLFSSSNNTISDNTASNNSHGIYLHSSSNNNTITGNNASNNYIDGIYLYSSSSNNFTGNNASNNDYCGISLESSSNNTIYNNYFNNTNNAYDDGTNAWNITKTAGTNIIGGPYLGGNYWSDYAGVDPNYDGLGDTLVPYNSSGNIQNGGDYLPLVYPSATTEGTVYEANTSALGGANVVLLCGGSEIASTTSDATGYYNFRVEATGNYTVNVTKGGFFSPVQKWANITALNQTITRDFKGMDAPYRTAPDGYYCIKCSNLWLCGGWYPEGFALDATRVSDVLYAWTHPS